MTIDELLEQMRDPLGAPFYPEVLRALLILTWVLHIFFVTVALGSGIYTVYGYARKGEHRLRLARTTARLTPNAVGLGIVTGIAPLLFIQTIYDPIWYASNTLTGFWSVMFIFVVMGGYSLAYLFYMKGSEDGRLLWSAVVSVLLISFAGWIMHVLAAVQLRPQEWMRWYAPNGIIDTRGVVFHDFNLPRLAFILPLGGLLGIAVMMMLYAWYAAKSDADGADAEYLGWVAENGRRLGAVIAPMYAVAGVLWAFTQGGDYDMGTEVGVSLAVLGLGLTMYFGTLRNPAQHARRSLLIWFAALVVVATIRELIRSRALEQFGYRVADYPYAVDWGTVILFTTTTVVGTSILTYLALVLYEAGVGDGQVSRRVNRFGRFATGMLGAWFGFFLLLGLYTAIVLN
ncbi:MAG: hypothetical protein ACK5OX_05835 [Desertimonas sp.]